MANKIIELSINTFANVTYWTSPTKEQENEIAELQQGGHTDQVIKCKAEIVGIAFFQKEYSAKAMQLNSGQIKKLLDGLNEITNTEHDLRAGDYEF